MSKRETVKSVSERVALLEAEMETVKQIERAIYGHDSEVGLLAQTKEACNKLNSIQKVMWVVLTTIITLALAEVWSLLIQ